MFDDYHDAIATYLLLADRNIRSAMIWDSPRRNFNHNLNPQNDLKMANLEPFYGKNAIAPNMFKIGAAIPITRIKPWKVQREDIMSALWRAQMI